jgi:hypothetical protein
VQTLVSLARDLRFETRVSIQDRLLDSLRRCCRTVPDQRRGRNTTYDMADFALAAFAPFFMQSRSFLAHQRHLATGQGRSNCQTLFGLSKIPGDSHIRAKLDAVEPGIFHPMFADIVAELDQCGGLDAMRCLDQQVLIALDGTEFHCSDKIHCPKCSHRKRGKRLPQAKAGDKIEYFHSMLAATLVAPGHNRAVPLEPEFIVPQDGHDKQDCESRAARRWLATHGARYARFRPVYLGDDLFSRQPICEAVLETGGHFLFVCKPDSHKAIEEFRAGIVLDELTQKVRRGKHWATHRYQWLRGVPLRGDGKAITVNWLMIEIRNADGGVTYRNSFITDLDATRETVAELAACGRARWKIENEAFNVLKTKGYNLEHNFGHGKQHLSAVLAILNLLAFAAHTVCELGGRAWRAAMRELVTRQGFFQSLRTITTYLVFPSWDDLLATLAFTRPPPLGP